MATAPTGIVGFDEITGGEPPRGGAEIHVMQGKQVAPEQRARCVVIDPVAASSKAGNEGVAHGVAGAHERARPVAGTARKG